MTIPYPIDGLFALAESVGLAVVWYKQANLAHPCGRYVRRGEQGVIFLCPSLREDPIRLRCTLAHELGHHMTGACGLMPSDETRAEKWAERLLLPWMWLRNRLHLAVPEIAAQAGVYSQVVRNRLAILQSRRQLNGNGTSEWEETVCPL